MRFTQMIENDTNVIQLIMKFFETNVRKFADFTNRAEFSLCHLTEL